MVWVGIAIAAVVLLVMSLAIVVGGASSATVGQARPRAAETAESMAPERLAGTLAPPLKNKFITDAVDGEEVFGRVAVVAEFFSQLNDDLVERAGGAVSNCSPRLRSASGRARALRRDGRERFAAASVLWR